MTWMPGESYLGTIPKLTEKEKIIQQNTKSIVTKLATEIGERHIHKPKNLLKAVNYITTYLEKIGYTVLKQAYEVENIRCFNIEVEKPGSNKSDEIIVIGAHYDSVEYDNCPAANDNATGVAAALELARLLFSHETARTIRFVLFTNEEPPYYYTKNMGSLVYAKHSKKNKDNIVAMFSLETMGYYSDEPKSQKYPFPFNFFYPSTGNFIGFVSNISSGKLVRQTIKSFRKNTQFPSEGGAIWSLVKGVGWSDHWSFWKQGYPAIMVTDTALFRYPYYHTRQDTPDKLNYEKLALVVSGLEKVIVEISN